MDSNIDNSAYDSSPFLLGIREGEGGFLSIILRVRGGGGGGEGGPLVFL